MQQTLFGIDYRVFAVRRKRDIGQRLMSLVKIHICPARLLIGTKNKANLFVKLHTVVAERFNRIKGGNAGPLVIYGAAAVYPAILLYPFEGRHRPAVAHGNHVDVGQNAQHLIAITIIHIRHVSK